MNISLAYSSSNVTYTLEEILLERTRVLDDSYSIEKFYITPYLSMFYDKRIFL
mgnify:FL=1